MPQGGSVDLVYWAALTPFADATTAITIPPGYNLPLKQQLAIVLAPQYDIQPSDALVKGYTESSARIRALNAALLGDKPPAGQTDTSTAPPSTIQS
jgi:hypothetical protein